MDQPKYIFRHEVLNLLTIVRVLLKKNTLDKKEIEYYCRLISILIEHEDLFLDVDISLVPVEVSLEHILEVSLITAEEEKPTNIIFDFDDELIYVPAFYTQKAIANFLYKLRNNSEYLRFYIHEDHYLCIQHTIEDSSFFQKKTLIDCLEDKIRDEQELLFQLGYRLLEKMGVKISILTGHLCISFPQY